MKKTLIALGLAAIAAGVIHAQQQPSGTHRVVKYSGADGALVAAQIAGITNASGGQVFNTTNKETVTLIIRVQNGTNAYVSVIAR